MARTSYFSMI